MHIFFQNDNDNNLTYRRNAIPCYTDNTEKKVPNAQTTRVNSNYTYTVQLQIQIERDKQKYIYTQTNKQTKKQIKQKHTYLFIQVNSVNKFLKQEKTNKFKYKN